jgi:hypothetical protein
MYAYAGSVVICGLTLVERDGGTELKVPMPPEAF